MRRMLRGRRLLLVDSPDVNPRDGWDLIDLATTLYAILPSANVHLFRDPRDLDEVISQEVAELGASYVYDALVVLF